MERRTIDIRLSERGGKALGVVQKHVGSSRSGVAIPHVLSMGIRPDARWFARGSANGPRIKPLLDIRLLEDMATLAAYERIALERWIESLLVTAALTIQPSFGENPCFSDTPVAVRSWSRPSFWRRSPVRRC